jgi:hypothetical protein
MHNIDLMEYFKVPSKLFFVFVSLMLVLDEGALFHPKLYAVAIKDQIKLLVFYQLRSHFENRSYFGKNILFYSTKYKFARSNLTALIFVYLHAFNCK